MNFNNIVDNVIAGLIVSATVASVTACYKFLRKKYKENNFMIFFDCSFYIGLFSLMLSCFQFNFNVLFSDFFSLENARNLFLSICIIVNLRTIFISYKTAKDCIKYCEKYNNNK